MSQHILTTTMREGRKVTVTLGYDRPLDYVFCTVLDEDDDVIYSNLDDEIAGTELQDVEYFRPILKGLGIHVPETIFDEVNSDQLLRVGNRIVHHTADKTANWTQRLLQRFAVAMKAGITRIIRGARTSRGREEEPETLALLDVIGDEAATEQNYCSGSYRKWEDETATPLLEKMGYSDIQFSMGDCDSFGPLTRIVTAIKNGVAYRFIYG
jgi:hypothetical protein